MFTFKSRNKRRCMEMAWRIAENFEPNANYEVELYVRRDPRNHGLWSLSVRLIFPHMNYKRIIVQEDMTGSRLESRMLRMEPNIRRFQRIQHRFYKVLDNRQRSLSEYEFFTNIMNYGECETCRRLTI